MSRHIDRKTKYIEGPIQWSVLREGWQGGDGVDRKGWPLTLSIGLKCLGDGPGIFTLLLIECCIIKG